MKTKIQVTELTHEELVNILSGATYRNSHVDICVADESVDLLVQLKKDDSVNTECMEDAWAEVLLHGGSISVIDLESEAEDEADAIKCAYKGHGHRVGFTTVEGWSGEYGATVYDINLKEFLEGCSSEEAYKYLKDSISGDADMWDAYNLLQMITFGELIYG